MRRLAAVAGNFFFIATIVFLVGVAVMLGLRARSSRGHVGERQDGLPVAGGGAGGETPLEDGVGELRPAVAVGTKQVDLAATLELLGNCDLRATRRQAWRLERRRGRSHAAWRDCWSCPRNGLFRRTTPSSVADLTKDSDVES